MTRQLLTLVLLTGTLLLCAVAAPPPTSVAGAALAPEAADRTPGAGYHLDVRLGDGIFQVRIRGCEACQTSVTIEVKLPRLFGNPAMRRYQLSAVRGSASIQQSALQVSVLTQRPLNRIYR